jgi:hypothetical protein
VHANCLYISSGRNSAFTHHYAEMAVLSSVQLQEVLQERHTKEEWVQLLHSLKSVTDNGGDSLTTMAPSDGLNEGVLQSAIKPPKRFRSDVVASPAEGAIRSFASFDSEFEFVEIPLENFNNLPQEEALSHILLYWEDLTSNVNKFAKMRRHYQSMSNQNLEGMDALIMSVDARLGACPKHSLGDDCVTAWDCIMYLEDAITHAATAVTAFETWQTSLNDELELKIQETKRKIQGIVNDSTKAFKDISQFLKVLNDEQRLINRLVQNQPLGSVASTSTNTSLEEDLRRLNQKVSDIETLMLGHPTPAIPVASQDLASIKMQMKLSEARLPTHNLLKLGGFMFQSRADVALFVETKMPSNSFSMFHDVVTLMERLSGNYVEQKDVINEWYQATKVGLGEHEAHHVASFKITNPTVFGYVKEGTANIKQHLPAVKSFKEWNSFDSESGVKSFILNGMGYLKLQLYQDISTFFDEQFYDARVLANDMLSMAQIFVAELSNWMDVFYQELLTTSEASEDEAWELVSACVKKVFEELRRVRASAANATSEADSTSKCSTIMWALIQAHRVMKDFLDMHFRNHPSIAPVIILHVFKTRVTPVSYSTNLKRLEGRTAKLEATPAFKNPKPNPKDTDDKKVGKN